MLIREDSGEEGGLELAFGGWGVLNDELSGADDMIKLGNRMIGSFERAYRITLVYSLSSAPIIRGRTYVKRVFMICIRWLIFLHD